MTMTLHGAVVALTLMLLAAYTAMLFIILLPLVFSEGKVSTATPVEHESTAELDLQDEEEGV